MKFVVLWRMTLAWSKDIIQACLLEPFLCFMDREASINISGETCCVQKVFPLSGPTPPFDRGEILSLNGLWDCPERNRCASKNSVLVPVLGPGG